MPEQGFAMGGAFVDIGVHQDGLVHISALPSTFVKDPHSVVKAGQIVKVNVRKPRDPRGQNKAAGRNRIVRRRPRWAAPWRRHSRS